MVGVPGATYRGAQTAPQQAVSDSIIHSRALSRSAFEAQRLCLFLEAYLPQTWDATENAGLSTGSDWPSLVRQMDGDGTAVTPEWKIIPWTVSSKSPEDHLLDILLDIPEVLERYDGLRASVDLSKQRELRDALRLKCPMGHGKRRNRLLYAPSKQPSLTELESLKIKALYLTGCLLLYTTWKMVSDAGSPIAAPPDPSYSRSLEDIAALTPMLLSASTGMFGKQVASWPLAIALQFFMAFAQPQFDKQKAALVKCLDGPQAQVIREFIHSMNADSQSHPPWMTDMGGTRGIIERARKWVGIETSLPDHSG
ncbi:unnamed protein product [Parascedosporium putredinis]|uniref:Uncharacterized protein n=1 Tax=Parascedosporium putredinis TaxID=1442378 RepID=A0A9P1GZU6_9PEZI|nr:unnamed protein product [Parascedosporium putredinis]CAI7993217.1 unnamed protein product [Parascedosporium putredinis]